MRPRRPRPPIYSAQITVALVFVWTLRRYPASKRLSPKLVTLVAMLKRDGDLDLIDADATLLVSVSAATIDRRLKPERVRLELQGRSHTSPGPS
ncbi:MAG: hypothetical protein HKL87_05275 [Acidimicrobiaceae bacterium]|nr:hypothetical protein [Acidimicrobiaceae bacterium]